MKAVRSLNRFLFGILGLALLAGVPACENPVEHEDHPIGLALVAGGNVVASFTPTAQTGQVMVSVGSTTALQVMAVGEDGDLLDIDGVELEVRVDEVDTGPGITAAIQNVDEVVITANTAGTSTLALQLLHEDHVELEALFVVVVE